MWVGRAAESSINVPLAFDGLSGESTGSALFRDDGAGRYILGRST